MGQQSNSEGASVHTLRVPRYRCGGCSPGGEGGAEVKAGPGSNGCGGPGSNGCGGPGSNGRRGGPGGNGREGGPMDKGLAGEGAME